MRDKSWAGDGGGGTATLLDLMLLKWTRKSDQGGTFYMRFSKTT